MVNYYKIANVPQVKAPTLTVNKDDPFNYYDEEIIQLNPVQNYDLVQNQDLETLDSNVCSYLKKKEAEYNVK